ncbi:MAG: glycosyltransferase family 39 protein [Solirubrobacteraceae bacterium]
MAIRGRVRRFAGWPRAPLVALAIVSVLSFGARVYQLGQPCQSPCTTANDHTLIFDEAYYVNAARVIAGIHPPAGDHYSHSPLGTDPNAEHPQGAKLIMAAAIELFGDGPFAWRIGSLLMGSIAILGMFALVRAAGGGSWPAVGASALMACDNLLLVHGRIGTLDIYAVAMMVWGVALYLRRKPVLAGVVLAIGTCFKELTPYALFALVLLEVGRLIVARRAPGAPDDWRAGPAFGRLAATIFVTSGVFVGLLGLMGLVAQPYADAEGKLITGGPFNEIAHIINYAAALTSPKGPQGIASYPWQWLIDLKPIVYLSVSSPLPGHLAGAIRPVSLFVGMVSPPILALGEAALAVFAWRLARVRAIAPQPVRTTADAVEPPGRSRTVSDVQLMLLAVAWFLGTWVPYALQVVFDQRTSYLYYMVVVMPGIYVGAIHFASVGWRRQIPWLRALLAVWALLVVAAAVLLYPFMAVF